MDYVFCCFLSLSVITGCLFVIIEKLADIKICLEDILDATNDVDSEA